MKISHIKIRNILGIEELEFNPGGFTAVKGRNGTGKTSVLEAVKAALSGGSDATLLRNGAEEGEVVLVLDDGTEVSKRVKATGSTVKVRGADGVEKSSPATRVKQLVDALSVNPVEFLSQPKQKRAAALLEAMPLQADPKRIRNICGVAVDADGRHALEVIEHARKAVYDDRTGTNRAAKEKRSTITQLQASLPVADVKTTDIAELQAQVDKIESDYDAELLRVQNKLDELSKSAADRIQELQEQIQVIKDEQAEFAIKAANARAKADRIKSEAMAVLAPVLAEANEAVKANERAEGTRDAIKKLISEAELLEATSEQQTEALSALDAYRAELVDDLPISGLTIVDGDIYQDSVPLDRLNTAQQVRIAVEVAKLRAGKLPIVCVDGIERLDAEAYEAFKSAAKDSGIQFVVTRVEDGDFAVEVSQ